MKKGTEGAEISRAGSRIVWIDIMRGFLMFWVIFGHITEEPDQYIYIYSFHMPAYFFLTGITFAFNKTKSTPGFIAKKFFELMVPYFILNIYAAPLREWLEIVDEVNDQNFGDLILGVLYSNSDSGYKMASNTLWFIPCLFLATVMFFLILKLCRNRALPAAIMVAAVTVAAWLLEFDEGSGGPSHYRGAIFSVMFILSGYLFSRYLKTVENVVRSRKFISSVVAGAMLLEGYVISSDNGYVSIIKNEYKSLLMFYASALISVLALTVIMILITDSDRAVKLCRPLDFIGRKTLPYIAFQVPIMKLMWYYMPDTFGTRDMPWSLIQTIILFFAMMPLALWVDRLVPRVMPDSLKKPLRKALGKARKIIHTPLHQTGGQDAFYRTHQR